MFIEQVTGRSVAIVSHVAFEYVVSAIFIVWYFKSPILKSRE
jgi:hypothetical protein